MKLSGDPCQDESPKKIPMVTLVLSRKYDFHKKSCQTDVSHVLKKSSKSEGKVGGDMTPLSVY